MSGEKKIFVNGSTGKYCLFVKNIAGISESNHKIGDFTAKAVIYLDAGHFVYVKQEYSEVLSLIAEAIT